MADARPLDARPGVVDNVGGLPWLLPHLSTWPSRWTAPVGIRRPGASPTPGLPSSSRPATGSTSSSEAERGLLDFVTIEDSLALQSTRRRELDERTDQVRGRLDAVLVAARVARARRPSASSRSPPPPTPNRSTCRSRSPPSTTSATGGPECRPASRRPLRGPPVRAPRVIADPTRSGDLGRAGLAPDLFDEAADFIEVVRRLWDSWEDDAEIRDVATGRFVDRDKAALHRLRREMVLGQEALRSPLAPRKVSPRSASWPTSPSPSRWPRGQPTWSSSRRTPPRRPGTSSPRSGAMRRPKSRPGPPLRIFADVVVFLDDVGATAARRKDRLDELYGRRPPLRRLHPRRHTR